MLLLFFSIPAAVIGFSPVVYSVDEGAGVVTLEVAVLNGMLGADVIVKLVTMNDVAVGKYIMSSLFTGTTSVGKTG